MFFLFTLPAIAGMLLVGAVFFLGKIAWGLLALLAFVTLPALFGLAWDRCVGPSKEQREATARINAEAARQVKYWQDWRADRARAYRQRP